MRRIVALAFWLCWLNLGPMTVWADAEETPLTDKTLVVWASLENLDQSGGTALTVNDTTIDRFDGVVFAELAARVWMPGSNGYTRTQQHQQDWPQENDYNVTMGLRFLP